MENRTLTITVQADWKNALRAAAQSAHAPSYQGETLNFERTASGGVYCPFSDIHVDLHSRQVS